MSEGIRKYSNYKNWIIIGYIFLIVFLGGTFLWAFTSSISGAIIASGVIGVEGKVKTIQHLDGGIVREILISDGDLVEAGELLIRLDDTDIKANLAIITDSFYKTHAIIARLKAERDLSKSIAYPQVILDTQGDKRIKQAIKTQNLQFVARRKNMDGRAKVLEQKILQLREQIVGLKAQRVAVEKQRDIIRQDIDIKKPAVERGIVTGDLIRSLEQKEAQYSGQYEQIGSQIAQARSAIEETKLQILQLDMDFNDKVLTDLENAETRVAELHEKKMAAEDRLRRVEIRSPSNGRVHDLSIHTIGGVISPAKPIMQIIPEGSQLIIEAKISPTDIDNVKIGQEGAVHLSAFASRSTPVLVGHVKNRSAALLIDQITGVSYFSVDIEISQDELNRLNEKQVLVTGMPAEVFIQTEQRNALSYLLKPFLDVLEKAFREE